MCKIVGVLILLGAAGAVLGLPALDKQMQNVKGDTALVESMVRETRAVVPEHIGELLAPGIKDAFIHTYGDKEGDAGDIQGYSKKLNDKGNDGYEHFDSFHKKDADKYGYEVHSEFGKSDKASVDVADKNGKYSDEKGEKEGAEDDGEETQDSYRVVGENNKGDKKNKKAVEEYDFGYYGSAGDVAKYIDLGSDAESGGGGEEEAEGDADEGESQTYAEGGEYEEGGEGDGNYEEGEGESSSYSSDDGEGAEEEGDGESEGYSEADEEEE